MWASGKSRPVRAHLEHQIVLFAKPLLAPQMQVSSGLARGVPRAHPGHLTILMQKSSRYPAPTPPPPKNHLHILVILEPRKAIRSYIILMVIYILSTSISLKYLSSNT